MPDFRAVLIRKDGDTQHAELARLALAELMDGDVVMAMAMDVPTDVAPVVRGRPVIDMSR